MMNNWGAPPPGYPQQIPPGTFSQQLSSGAPIKEEVFGFQAQFKQDPDSEQKLRYEPNTLDQFNKCGLEYDDVASSTSSAFKQEPDIKSEPIERASWNIWDLGRGQKRNWEAPVKQEIELEPSSTKRSRIEAPPASNPQFADGFDENRVLLDLFNSDLSLKIDKSTCLAALPEEGPCFSYMWHGVRATFGFKKGRVCFEVSLDSNIAMETIDDQEEQHPNVLRVGWSVDDSGLTLGEEPLSWGYGGTGKASTNLKFKDYGSTFDVGDVVSAYLDLDVEPIVMTFAVNGRSQGIAYEIWSRELKGQALYPHILTKNMKFSVNFGEAEQSFSAILPGYTLASKVPVHERVLGTSGPRRREDCEVIMMIGLPACGKSTWVEKYVQQHKEKRYNVLGTNNLIDKMKVDGLPRKRNYHGRWDVLIQTCTKGLNRLLELSGCSLRNFVIDQTNVYRSARKRKMKGFASFYRRALVMVTTDKDLKLRTAKREREDGKLVPDEAILDMKGNFLPVADDEPFDSIEYIELPKEEAEECIRVYNEEGKDYVKTYGDRGRGRGRSGFDNRGGRGGGDRGSRGGGGFINRGGRDGGGFGGQDDGCHSDHRERNRGDFNNRGEQIGSDFSDRGKRGGEFKNRGGRGAGFNERGGRDGENDPPFGRGGVFDSLGGCGREYDNRGGRGRGFDGRGGRGGGSVISGGRGLGYDIRGGRGREFDIRGGRGREFDIRSGRGREFDSHGGRSGEFDSRGGWGGGFDRRGGRSGGYNNRGGRSGEDFCNRGGRVGRVGFNSERDRESFGSYTDGGDAHRGNYRGSSGYEDFGSRDREDRFGQLDNRSGNAPCDTYGARSAPPDQSSSRDYERESRSQGDNNCRELPPAHFKLEEDQYSGSSYDHGTGNFPPHQTAGYDYDIYGSRLPGSEVNMLSSSAYHASHRDSYDHNISAGRSDLGTSGDRFEQIDPYRDNTGYEHEEHSFSDYRSGSYEEYPESSYRSRADKFGRSTDYNEYPGAGSSASLSQWSSPPPWQPQQSTGSFAGEVTRGGSSHYHSRGGRFGDPYGGGYGYGSGGFGGYQH